MEVEDAGRVETISKNDKRRADTQEKDITRCMNSEAYDAAV